jgi:hypothetical protein
VEQELVVVVFLDLYCIWLIRFLVNILVNYRKKIPGFP